MKLGAYQFTDDNGDTWDVDDDGNSTLIAQGQPPTTNNWGPVDPAVITSTPTTPANSAGTPTVTQAAAIVKANPAAPGVTDWLSQLAAAVPKALQLYNAQQIASVNIRRAEQGLSPLNAGLYGPQVGVAMNPDTQRMIMYGALGIGALLLLGGRKR